MNPCQSKLDQFTTDDLLAEIVRRRNDKAKSEAPRKWCDDCKNFKGWEKIGDAPDDYNPCLKHHSMSFRVPKLYDDPYSFSWGFFRRVCEDRNEMTEQEQAKEQDRMAKVWKRIYGYKSSEEYAHGLSEVPTNNR